MAIIILNVMNIIKYSLIVGLSWGGDVHHVILHLLIT